MRPVYVDGPLAGQQFEVSSGTYTVFALEHEPVPGEPLRHTGQQITYRICQYTMFGRVFRVATSKPYGEEPDQADLFEHLVSDGVKAALADG